MPNQLGDPRIQRIFFETAQKLAGFEQPDERPEREAVDGQQKAKVLLGDDEIGELSDRKVEFREFAINVEPSGVDQQHLLVAIEGRFEAA